MTIHDDFRRAAERIREAPYRPSPAYVLHPDTFRAVQEAGGIEAIGKAWAEHTIMTEYYREALGEGADEQYEVFV